jgi:hypothetical protein
MTEPRSPATIFPEEPPPTDILAVLTAAQSYLDAETARLNGPSPTTAKPTVPDLAPFPDATLDGQSVLLEVEPGYVDRFDSPMVLALKVAIAAGGYLRTNSREAPKILGRSRHYVRLDFAQRRGQRLYVQVNRLVVNVGPNERVHEHPQDHHNHMPEALTKSATKGRGKTRADVVAMAAERFQLLPSTHPARLAFTVTAFRQLLWGLFTLADTRWQERMVRDAVATTPWEHPDLIA